MERFVYQRAKSIEHAVRLLNQPGIRSRVLAGGTDLLLLMREEQHASQCDHVIDITMTPELHEVRQEGDRVVIGAAATFSEILESPLVNETAPVLAKACHSVGATQIRNMGTLGGNVANAAACADSVPALVCLDAVAHVLTPSGALEWPVSEFITWPNRTKLPTGGLLIALSYRIPAPGSRSTFLKLGRRNAMAISRLTVAALGSLATEGAQGRVAEARVAVGSAAPQIRRFPRTEGRLLGQLPTTALCEEAGQIAVAEMAEIAGKRWSSEFKEPALRAMVTRALLQVFGLSSVQEELA